MARLRLDFSEWGAGGQRLGDEGASQVVGSKRHAALCFGCLYDPTGVRARDRLVIAELIPLLTGRANGPSRPVGGQVALDGFRSLAATFPS